MPEEDQRHVPRTGGWPPPYQGGMVRHSDRLPVPVPYRRPPVPIEQESPHAGKVLLACAVVVVAGVGGMMALLLPTDESQPPAPIAERMVFPTPPIPSAPVSVLPPSATSASFGPSPSRTPTPGAVRTSAVSNSRPAPSRPSISRPAPPAPSPSRSATSAPTGGTALTAGRTVGLEVRGMTGFRVRHRDYLARIDRVTADSSALDRADASFVVRRGLGGAGCISFESVNYPGHYLRHRDFTVRIDRRDRSSLFARDATFCPSGRGEAVTLRSLNYPGHAIAVGRGGTLRIDDDRATAFVVRAPL